MSTIQIQVHAHYAIAIDAMAAAHGIREDISGWQPMIVPGFQGRMIILLQESSVLEDGEPDGAKRDLSVVAIGTDGEVRQWYDDIRDSIVSAEMVVHDQRRNAMVDAKLLMPASTASGRGEVASASSWDKLRDQTLAHAMPFGALGEREMYLRLHVVATLRNDERRARLAAYRDAFIAPRRPLSSRHGSYIEGWTINFGIFPMERLYAMCEVFGGNAVVEVEPNDSDRPGLEVLRDAFEHWFASEVQRRAA